MFRPSGDEWEAAGQARWRCFPFDTALISGTASPILQPTRKNTGLSDLQSVNEHQFFGNPTGMSQLKRPLRIILLIVVVAAFLVGLAETRPESTLAPFLKNRPENEFIVVGHRGASKQAPENTLAAFAKALESGSNGIEGDVIFTRDDVPVIAHHHDLSDRVPPGQRPAVISEMDLSQVKELDVGSWFSEEFKGERIPTLKEGLTFLRRRVDRIYLHDRPKNDYSGPKEERMRVFANEIRESGMRDRTVVMVNSGYLSLWQKLAPDISLLQCWNGPEHQRKYTTPLEESFRLGIRHMGFYHSRGQLGFGGRALAKMGLVDLGTFLGFWPTREVVDSYRAKNSDFTVFTINDPFLMKLYIDAGFKAIGTDEPSLLRSIVNSRQ